MSESNSIRLSLQRTKFLATGGVVLGATAIINVFGIPTILCRDESTDDAGRSINAYTSAAFPPEIASNDSDQFATPTSLLNASTGSNDSNKDPFIRVDSIASRFTEPLIATRDFVPMLRASLPKNTTSFEDNDPVKRQLRNIFDGTEVIRLKLYWEDGYFWQEKAEEKWYVHDLLNRALQI